MRCLVFLVSAVLLAAAAEGKKKAKIHHHHAETEHLKKVHHYPWDYAMKGPSTWAKSYLKCDGKKQSPINIIMAKTAPSNSLEHKIRSHNYRDHPGSGKYHMINNGHTLQLNLPTDTKYRINKGEHTYIPVQMHIHFDTVTGKGSEHALNSGRYFAEIHVVHRNAKYELATKQYLHNSDGLMVIGMFVELVKADKAADGAFNLNRLDDIVKMRKTESKTSSFAMMLFGSAAKKLKNPGHQITIPAFPLSWVFPITKGHVSKHQYVNYKGSLTTPPCLQIVDWIVFNKNILKTTKQYAKNMGEVINSNKKPMSGNFRPLHPLNGRQVYRVEAEL